MLFPMWIDLTQIKADNRTNSIIRSTICIGRLSVIFLCIRILPIKKIRTTSKRIILEHNTLFPSLFSAFVDVHHSVRHINPNVFNLLGDSLSTFTSTYQRLPFTASDVCIKKQNRMLQDRIELFKRFTVLIIYPKYI